jgi:hypothetical protein
MTKAIIILSICIATSAFAQDKTEEITTEAAKTTMQVGVNGTSFIKNFLSFTTTSIVLSPYLLTHKIIFPSGWAYRAGYGFNYNLTNKSDLSRDQSNLGLDIRQGMEKRWNMGKKIKGYVGLDLLYGLQSTQISTNVFNSKTDETTLENRLGMGPVLGLEYFFNKHFSISTEGSLYFTYGYSNTNFTDRSTGFPFTTNSNTTKVSSSISPPINIQLNYNF